MSKKAVKCLSEANAWLRKAVHTGIIEKRKFDLLVRFSNKMCDYCRLMAAFEENKAISIKYQQEAFIYQKFSMIFQAKAIKAGRAGIK